MAKMGKFTVKGLRELQKDLEKLQTNDKQKFIEACAKELAARLLRILIKNTLPGKYPAKSGKRVVHFVEGGQCSNQKVLR